MRQLGGHKRGRKVKTSTVSLGGGACTNRHTHGVVLHLLSSLVAQRGVKLIDFQRVCVAHRRVEKVVLMHKACPSPTRSSVFKFDGVMSSFSFSHVAYRARECSEAYVSTSSEEKVQNSWRSGGRCVPTTYHRTPFFLSVSCRILQTQPLRKPSL